MGKMARRLKSHIYLPAIRTNIILVVIFTLAVSTSCDNDRGTITPLEPTPRSTPSSTPRPVESTEIDYKHIRPVFWSSLYGNGGETLYCRVRFNSNESDSRRGLNIEHVMPMSWVARSLGCGSRSQCRRTSSTFNRIEADLHNLYPALTKINQARSSFRFGNVKGERREFGECDFEVDRRSKVAEPADAIRGDVARVLLYMQSTYGIEIYEKQARLLRTWAAEDAVDEEERRRNDIIMTIQGNRNALIR